MTHNNKRSLIKKCYLLISILLVATLIRFIRLGQIPIILNRDEASLGYTAFSIMRTGHDEHGVKFPINIQSFGDWKLPGYVYSLIPFIKFFGLKDWVVRAPSFLSGIGIVICIYLITKLLICQDKNLQKSKFSFPLLTTLMVSLSPWAVHFSRIAYEANLALFFFLLGLLAFLSAKKSSWLYSMTALFWGLAMITYHSYQIFVPLMAIFVFFRYKQDLKLLYQERKRAFFTPIAIIAIFLMTLLITGASKANQTKFSGLSIFDLKSYQVTIELEKKFFSNSNSLIAKLYSNKFNHLIFKLMTNILDLFSSEFFFLRGGSNGIHNISGVANFYIISAVFFIVGLIYFYQQKKLWQKFVIVWMLAAAVAPLITFEANHTTRFSPGFITVNIISAYGLYQFLNLFKNKKIIKVALPILLIIYAYSIYHYLITYFVIAPKLDADNWNWQYKRIVELVNEKKDDFDMVLMTGETSSPYIYFLYYLQIDPSTLADRIEYYPPTKEGFVHVKRLDNIHFGPIDWNNSELVSKKVLFVIDADQISADKKTTPGYALEYSLTYPYSKYEYQLWSKD